MIARNRQKTRLGLAGWLVALCAAILLAGCELELTAGGTGSSGNAPIGDTATVTRVIDGDTIEVRINEVGYRIRYIGVNTPERDEVCYREATDANAALVRGQTVTLVRDRDNTDQYGRLLRYVYVGSTFVNAELVRGGFAEAVEYPPNTAHAALFRQLEQEAARAGRGCHPTGIFDDGSYTR